MKEYNEAIRFLEELNTFGWKPGLERIVRLLELLGNPERDYPTIHIGGTNGKGSVTVTIATILKDQGYRVGQFISPEMFDVRERIQVNGEWIKEESLIKGVNCILEAIPIMLKEGFEGPTNFEVWTALGFLYFREQKVQFAVIEVGLGGEIDSTNVIDPLFSIVTNVSMDHKDYLGDTVVEIAKVKSGIVKAGRPLITGSIDEEVLRILEEKTKETNSLIYRFGREFEGIEKGFTERQSSFIFQNGDFEEEVSYSLVGHHQVINGSLALEAVWLLGTMGFELNFHLAIESMAKVFWAGRLEILHYRGRRILMDAAHNLEGAINLGLALRDIYEYKKLVFIVGILGDKERRKMIDCIGAYGDVVVVTKPNNPRAGDYSQVAEYFKAYSDEVYVREELQEALTLGLQHTGPEDLLCITGSIYMLKDIRALMEGEKK